MASTRKDGVDKVVMASVRRSPARVAEVTVNVEDGGATRVVDERSGVGLLDMGGGIGRGVRLEEGAKEARVADEKGARRGAEFGGQGGARRRSGRGRGSGWRSFGRIRGAMRVEGGREGVGGARVGGQRSGGRVMTSQMAVRDRLGR
ncbi:uncharacterized protein A4U43_C10F7600 [Asparagus officinalis]|uniref:Uncharacterized protein n=1 Tax=Asparagus officinalis TaxID=4686 RepID=A0A5P1E1K5_ASPOF|nr:uncharacterized protein A4U43_C10F7600 [Asparagus officinalis]